MYEYSSDRNCQRKNHVCKRCGRVMYPGGSSNHAKAVCSDGAFQASRPYTKALNDVSTKAFEEPPPFPQPDGIFTNGKFFNPAPFMAAVTSAKM